MLKIGPDHAEQGRTEQKPAEELPHDGRLADALHQFAEAAADKKEEAELGDEDRFRFPGKVLLGGKGDRGAAA
jgi:hypothetical protein